MTSEESHKNEHPFKTKTLSYFKDLSMIYDKDRTNGKDAQPVAGIIEDLEREENDNSETENIEDGIGVEEDGFT
ncbi:hypothetical protein J1N35_015595 [Gossypium stocksii]|uniref:Uncharacterized protein n=1 Tax=Gossypium stocksii TaxID=47602 RepID=A0A9D4AAH5_9ROSI|nr:hypothetical protein J1N35_015595 [Gossypium stocksii]